MGSIPLQKTGNVALDLFMSRLKSEMDPVLANLLVQGQLIKNVQLSATSATIIPHKLGRTQIGWFPADQNAKASIWRSAALNSSTLTLSSDANVVVSLWVF